jgi:hypothetical protein
MGKRGARKWTQEKTNLDTEIISEVRYLTNQIRQEIADGNWDMSEIERFRHLRFHLETMYDVDTLEEYVAVIPTVITMTNEYDFEIEWKEGSRAFKIVTARFLVRDEIFTIDLSDFK